MCFHFPYQLQFILEYSDMKILFIYLVSFLIVVYINFSPKHTKYWRIEIRLNVLCVFVFNSLRLLYICIRWILFLNYYDNMWASFICHHLYILYNNKYVHICFCSLSIYVPLQQSPYNSRCVSSLRGLHSMIYINCVIIYFATFVSLTYQKFSDDSI